MSGQIFVKFSDTPGKVVASLPPPEPQSTPASPIRKLGPPTQPKIKPPVPAMMPKISGAKTDFPAPPVSFPEVSIQTVQPPSSPIQPVPPAEITKKSST